MGIERIRRIEPVYKSKDSTSKRKEEERSFRECIKRAAKKQDSLDISERGKTYNKINCREDGGR